MSEGHLPTDQSQRIQQLERQLEERNHQMRAVLRISQALSSRIKLDDLLQATLEESLRAVRADAGTLYLYHPDDETLEFKYVLGPAADKLKGEKMPASQGVAGRVLQQGVALITDKPTPPPDIEEKTQYATRNMVTVPLKASDGEPIGVLQALNREGGVDFDDSDKELLMILATEAATAIETARLHEEARLAVVVKLMGDISHDVKNMVTPIEVGADTLRLLLDDFFARFDEGALPPQPSEPDHEQLRRTAAILREFYPEAIRMFLSGSRAVQDRVREIADAVKGIVSEPHFEPIALSRVVHDVTNLLKFVADQQGIEIVVALPDDLPLVPLDYKLLLSTLYNLINNAIGAMAYAKERHQPMKGHRIFVRACSRPQGVFPNGHYLHIEVADEGPGMPEEVRARLFTKDAVSTKPGGTGLGTSIVKNAVDAHGGLVWVESEPGQGSTFFIRLPLERSVPAAT